ncbi:MAG: group 1 truncated hemoglobin [Phycisphaerales bacterium]|nr:group 1 truncated hemoglobin [Phycisphaerales bacterium]
MRIVRHVILFGCVLAGMAGCATEKRHCGEKCAADAKSLYERLGGEAAVKAVVNDFVDRAAANPKVNFTRKGTNKEWQATPENVQHVKAMLVLQIGEASGGPQKYTGRDMKSTHRGMGISGAEFDALAGDLAATLDKYKVAPADKSELLSVVSSMRGDIVEAR